MSTPFRPLRDLLVIRPLATPGMIGAIHIPDSGLQRDKTGVWAEVIAAGPKVEHAKVGTRVHVCAYGSHLAGDEITVEGHTFTLIRERDINGVEQASTPAIETMINWCTVHNREATESTPKGFMCDRRLGGITMACQVLQKKVKP